MVGFLAASDERLVATVNAIADHLTDGPFVYRYKPWLTDDGLDGQNEGSFTVCSFWLVSALVTIGDLERARAHLEKLIGAASSLGLYGEELDPTTARHLGNFPQALTHLALITAVLGVIKAERQLSSSQATHGWSQNWWSAAGQVDSADTIASSDVWLDAPTNTTGNL